MGKYTGEDVKGLAEYMRAEQSGGNAVAFLTGAGCSVTAGIPLAHGIVQIARQGNSRLPEDYGQCMEAMGEAERRRILDPKLRDAKINWAHIALACLITKGWVNRVLTFNFDNVLVRACGLTGHYPAIYDFASAPTDTFTHIQDRSIIHLHGQGSGLRMMNSSEETKKHARKLAPLFKDTLLSRGLVVLGYSGANDAAFFHLAKNRQNQHHFYWCSFDEEPAQHVAKLLGTSRINHHLGGVDADVFLIELAQELKCFPPTVLQFPEAHLLEELKDVVDYPENAGGNPRILVNLRAELEAKDAQRKESPDRYAEYALRGEWDKLAALPTENATDDQKGLVAWGHIMPGIALAAQAGAIEDPAAKIARLKKAGAKYRAALAIKPDSHEALSNWGAALADQAGATEGRAAKIALLTEAGKKFEAALAIKPDSHEALNNWGAALAARAGATEGRAAQIALLEEAGEKFEAALAIKPNKHEALYNWGTALADQAEATEDPAAKIALLTEAGKKFEDALAIKPDSHAALTNWGTALAARAGATEDAPAKIALLEEAEAKYQAALDIKPDDHEALYNWGNALAAQARATEDPEAKIALLIAAEEKYRAVLAIKPDKHEALYNWGNALADQARATEDPEAQIALLTEAGEKFEATLAIRTDFEPARRNLVRVAELLNRLRGP